MDTIWLNHDNQGARDIIRLVYSVSNINVPNDIAGNVKRRLFCFLWKNKRDKTKSEGLYQDYDKGGLRMTDIETMIKALRLAWIPRLLEICSRSFFKNLWK